MTQRKFWPVAILFAAIVFYFWTGEDEPVPGKEAQQEPFAETPAMTAPVPKLQSQPMRDGQSAYQAPAATPGGRPYGYYSEQDGRIQAPLSGQYRFRSDSEKDSTAKYLPDPYGRPPPQDQRYVMPAPAPQDYPGTGIFKAPDETTSYRFRPLDEKRQSKRWEGNYARKPLPLYQPPNPYPYENYPPPLNHTGPAAEGNSLWADSWPGR